MYDPVGRVGRPVVPGQSKGKSDIWTWPGQASEESRHFEAIWVVVRAERGPYLC
jgi:hypothetical protein